MFSLLTLQPTHSIDSFSELAKRVDVIPITYMYYETAVKTFNHPLLNAIGQSRPTVKFKDVGIAEFINPKRVFLETEMTVAKNCKR